MKTIKIFLSLFAASGSFLLIGCSNSASQNGTPALFDTRVEAEKAAKEFNCTGAHKMGDKWMPCKNHKDHQGNTKQGAHGHHHH